MRSIAVIPTSEAGAANQLLRAAGWRASAAPTDVRDPGVALDIVRQGEPALYVPAGVTPSPELRRVLVVHEGTRGDRAGMDAADDAAVASGAEVVVLHVPPASPVTSSASLPFRIADHGTYDWAEWREEFLRRFCRCSPGVRVTLHVSAGSPSTLRNQVRDEAPDLVIISGPSEGEDGPEEMLGAVADGRAPVLLVPAIGHESETAQEAHARGAHARDAHAQGRR